MALFFCLFWLFLLIPPNLGFARNGETYQMKLGIRSDGKTSSVGQREESKHATATASHVAPTPPTSPMRLPETQSVVFFWKTDQGSVESRAAKVKGDGDVIEIMSENRKLPILGSQLVLVIAPLPPGDDIRKLTKERVDLASNRYDRAEKIDELKTLLADGRAKWKAIKANPEAPVLASNQRDSLRDLDVTTAAGVEEPAPVLAKDETKPKTGWESWISWAKSFTGKAEGGR